VVNNRNRVVDSGGRGPADHIVAEISAAGGEAVAEYSDAADPGAGQAMVEAALRRWGRLNICVANAAIGVGGMFHRQPAEQFDEILAINLQGSIRLARAAMAVMRPAGYGRKHMDPDAVAPVLTALASEDCRLNGEYIVTGGGRLRRGSVVEWGTVPLPDDPDLRADELATLLAQSSRGEPKEFGVSVDAFNDLMDDGSVGELGPAAGQPGGHRRGRGRADAGDVFLRDADPGARDHGHGLAARVRSHRAGVVRAVGGFRRYGPSAAGAGAHRRVGAPAGHAHLFSQRRPG
jgi:Enoyl-(Acyl carrier protein) reductase